jgi:hypothetical protein
VERPHFLSSWNSQVHYTHTLLARRSTPHSSFYPLTPST